MAITFVQYNDNEDNSAGTEIVQSSSLNTTTGNFIAVTVEGYDTDSNALIITGVADTEGNSYVKAIGVYRTGTTNHRAEIWYAEDITGNAANVVTATFTGTCSYTHISVSEYSGVALADSLDDTSSNVQNSTSHTTGDMTCSEAGDLIIGATANTNSSNLTPGAGYTSLRADSSGEYYWCEYKIEGAADDYAATYESSAQTNSIFVGAAFKPAGGEPAGTKVQLNIGDVWKEVDGLQINIGDDWKGVDGAQINIGDSWKEIF